MNSVSTPAAEAGAAPQGRHVWKGLLGIAISLAFLYWAFRDVRLADVARELRHANPWWYLGSVVLVTCTFPLRAFRWQILLAASTGRTPRLKPVWQAVAIGFMANNLLPARAGEVARAWSGGHLTDTPMTTALSTIGVERVFDGLVVVFLLVLGIAAVDFPEAVTIGGTSLRAIAFSAGALFAAALLLLAAMVRAPEAVLALADRWIARWLPARAGAWTMRAARHLFDGLTVLRSPRDFGRVLTWSFAVWLANAGSYYLAFRAFHFDTLPFTATLVLQGIVVLGVAVPSSPGFAGVFETFCIIALGIYGVAKSDAASFAVGVHLGWFVPITALGLAVLARTGLRFRDLQGREEPR